MEESSQQPPEAGVSRKRLIPWFKRKLDKGDIPGLKWRSRDQKIWQLPWKIHRETKVGDPDAYMLLQLAKALHDFREEVPTQAHLKQWKLLVRNSLGSLKKSVKELPELHDQQADPPYKVYQFIDDMPKQDGQSRGRGKASISRQLANSGGSSPANSATCSYSVSSTDSPDSMCSYAGELSQHVAGSHIVLNPLPRLDEMAMGLPATGSLIQSQHSQDSIFSQTTPHAPSTLFPPTMFQTSATSQAQDSAHLLKNFSDGISEDSVTELVNQLIFAANTGNTESGTAPRSSNSYRSRSPVRQNDDARAESIDSAPTSTSNTVSATLPLTSAYLNSNACAPSLAVLNQYGLDVLSTLEMSSLSDIEKQFDDDVMFIMVYYNNDCVMKQPIKHHKFRMCFVADDARKEIIMTCPNQGGFGPKDANLIELPPFQANPGLPQERCQMMRKVLNDIERGFMIEYSDTKDIYVTRYCKRVLFFSIPELNKTERIKREERVKLFDFGNISKISSVHQLSAVQPFVRLTFYYDEPNPTCEEAVKVVIYHMECLRMQKKARETPRPNEHVCSLSDEFDKKMKIVDTLTSDHF